ncbi:MAG: Veg family protein [Clostridiales bacterium]|nr:Veg family protein [Clostridiales bacterium]
MKSALDIDGAKSLVLNLLGRSVDVKLNRGRNKIKRYKGVISEAHSNVFVIKLTDDIFDRISCSYIDLVCGEISLREMSSSIV